MVLGDFLGVCTFLLVTSFLIGVFILFYKLDEAEKKRYKARKAKEKADFEAYVQSEIEDALSAHFCGCHCNNTTATCCDDCKNFK